MKTEFYEWRFEVLEEGCKNLALLTGEDRKETREKAQELVMEVAAWRMATEPAKIHAEKKEKLQENMANLLNLYKDRIGPGR